MTVSTPVMFFNALGCSLARLLSSSVVELICMSLGSPLISGSPNVRPFVVVVVQMQPHVSVLDNVRVLSHPPRTVISHL